MKVSQRIDFKFEVHEPSYVLDDRYGLMRIVHDPLKLYEILFSEFAVNYLVHEEFPLSSPPGIFWGEAWSNFKLHSKPGVTIQDELFARRK